MANFPVHKLGEVVKVGKATYTVVVDVGEYITLRHGNHSDQYINTERFSNICEKCGHVLGMHHKNLKTGKPSCWLPNCICEGYQGSLSKTGDVV